MVRKCGTLPESVVYIPDVHISLRCDPVEYTISVYSVQYTGIHQLSFVVTIDNKVIKTGTQFSKMVLDDTNKGISRLEQ